MSNNFHYKFIKPDNSFARFVESIGIFYNPSDEPKEVVVMPDGRIDLFFLQSSAAPFQVILIGLETYPEQRSIPPHTLAFVISFKPLAVEYILHTSIAGFINSAKELPNNFWDFDKTDLQDFDSFLQKSFAKINFHFTGKNR